jgi:hypothetical protein
MSPQNPRLEATLKHRSLIPVTVLALLAIGCETSELGPKPVWAGGDAPTLADTNSEETSSGDTSSGDTAVLSDTTATTPDAEATPDADTSDATMAPETVSDTTPTSDADVSSDTAPTSDADVPSDTAPTVDADASSDTAPTVDADASSDAAPTGDADAEPAVDVTEDAAVLDVTSDLPNEDLAQADVPGCDPDSDPTCAGALAPSWQLENVAQATVGFGETYGLEAYAGTVTVLALLTGG